MFACVKIRVPNSNGSFLLLIHPQEKAKKGTAETCGALLLIHPPDKPKAGRNWWVMEWLQVTQLGPGYYTPNRDVLEAPRQHGDACTEGESTAGLRLQFGGSSKITIWQLKGSRMPGERFLLLGFT